MDRIEDLVIKINKARNDYYNGQSLVSDQVYDTWIDELYKLDPKNPAVIGIGCDPSSGWEEYSHKIPMGSLNKCQTEDEYKFWHSKYVDDNDKVLFTLKLDGLSVSIIYENGVLVKAATRGNGTAGELITQNVAKMIGVPLRLKENINITVRGEILLSKDNYKKYFSEYSNTRNAASGISRRYDGEGCDKLTVLTYYLFSEEFESETQEEMFKSLEELGFLTPKFLVLKSYDEVINLKNEYQNSLREKYEFDLDGIVIHNNEISKQNISGSLKGRPYASIAYKFDAIYKEATISEILVTVGNSGRLTPVAIFNPKVDLLGAKVEKASLHNFRNIKDLGVDVGCKVLVCRSNDVIPYIEEVSESTGSAFQPPTICPECGTKVLQMGEYLQCPNTSGCKAQLCGRIKNWVKELNLLEWGDSLIEKLIESKKVKSIDDLYKLSIEDLSSIDRMGKKSAKKCYDILWNNNEITLDVFLGALSIPMIGSTTIKQIMDAGCDTLEKFGQLKAEQFKMVSGIGPNKAKSLEVGLLQNQSLILSLIDNKVKIKEKVIGKLTGKRIAITGTTKNKRSDLEKFICENGGEYKSSVTKSCTHLVTSDSENSLSKKSLSAKKLGIELISEEDLLKMEF